MQRNNINKKNSKILSVNEGEENFEFDDIDEQSEALLAEKVSSLK